MATNVRTTRIRVNTALSLPVTLETSFTVNPLITLETEFVWSAHNEYHIELIEHIIEMSRLPVCVLVQ